MRLNLFILCLACWAPTICFTADAVCQTQAAISNGDESQAKQQRTRTLILKFFPDLDKDSVEGWVDSYSSMNEAELTQLLQQRQMLGVGGAGFSGMQLDLPKFQIEEASPALPADKNTVQDTPIHRAIKIVRANLSGLQVSGYRCCTFYFEHAGQLNDKLGPMALHTSWNLATGEKHLSGRNLDLVIRGNDQIMFRLEPGCVLTRSGRFVRLPDGRLGQKVGGKNLVLSPEIRIPEAASSFRIDDDGAVVSQVDSSEQVRFGQITGVRVKDTSQLKSTNGVYFTVSQEDQPTAFQPAKQLAIETGMLELSNVDVSRQQHLLEILQTMLEVSQSGN